MMNLQGMTFGIGPIRVGNFKQLNRREKGRGKVDLTKGVREMGGV